MSTPSVARPRVAPSRRHGRIPGLGRLPLALVVAIVVAAVILALFGKLLAPQDPAAQDLLTGAAGPSTGHLLGTDDLGRDVLSRLMSGAWTAVLGPAVIATGSLLLGSTIGLVAGYRGGRIGNALMRTVDLIYALPALLVAVVVAGVLDGGYWLAVGLLVVLFCPYDARVVRGAVLTQRGLPYVEAARLLGTPARRVMLAEIWPNVRGVELANAFLNFAFGLVALAALSFLGIGAGPGTAEWGRMLADARGYLELNPWGALGPGLAIALVAAAVTLLGDRLEERIADQGQQR